MAEIIPLDPDRPGPDLLERAAAVLRAGGVIAYPTETFYGLGADAANADAIERIFTIKGRPANSPIALIASGERDIQRLVREISPAARLLMKSFWPGPLTLLFPARDCVNPRLTAGTGKIGLRISSHPIAQELTKAVGRSITATSANLSGSRECSTAGEVEAQLGEFLDAIIDGGPTRGKAGSTIADMTLNPPVILREGALPASPIYDLLRSQDYL